MSATPLVYCWASARNAPSTAPAEPVPGKTRSDDLSKKIEQLTSLLDEHRPTIEFGVPCHLQVLVKGGQVVKIQIWVDGTPVDGENVLGCADDGGDLDDVTDDEIDAAIKAVNATSWPPLADLPPTIEWIT